MKTNAARRSTPSGSPTRFANAIELFDTISVSAGIRGAQLILRPTDYIRATNANVGAIAKPK